MAEWFQQQLERRNCQQSQRWCRVYGNSIHMGGVQQPDQQGDRNSTNIYRPLTQMRETINGYMWSFQLPINVKYLNTEDTSMTWAFQQCFQYGGLTMLANMEPTMCLKLVKYADNNCITLKTGVKDEDRLRGSNNLVKYILANNKTVIQQHVPSNKSLKQRDWHHWQRQQRRMK